jgi:glucuronate isomerase
MSFLGEEYLLDTNAATELYGRIEGLPIVDPHTHVDIDEILANEHYDDIWAVEGATDHYVWQLMRKRGISEAKITGDASNRAKWDALAAALPMMAGNPTYEWLHLDLKRRFGIEEPVRADTADEIWTETKRQLHRDGMRPQAILREMGVEVLCSTDDPTSDLSRHREFAETVDGVTLRPTWRPDRAMKVGEPAWDTFREDLAAATDADPSTFEGFLAGLAETHRRFREHGCRACDIGTGPSLHSAPIDRARAGEVFTAARRGRHLSTADRRDFWAFMLEWIGELNVEAGWTTQLHVGAVRDYRESVFDRVGHDAGGDVSTVDVDLTADLEYFLDAFDGELDVVVYTLDPTHYPTLTVLARAYPNVSVGPAWWFNDSRLGLDEQLERVASVDLLANYAGMVSDSRKLVSYGSRFELFRRTLANVLGHMVDRGQVPMSTAGALAEHVAYDRPKELYGL